MRGRGFVAANSAQVHVDLSHITKGRLHEMPKDQLLELSRQILDLQRGDRKENQLLYYQPASPRACQVHHSRARTTGVFGGNGCLPLTAPVLMADGTWKPLGQVKIGDRVIGADPVTGIAEPCNVLRAYRSGVRPVYRIGFSDGGGFEATEDHRVPLYLGSGRKTSKGKPKRPNKRELRDYIEAINIRGAKNPSKRISAVAPIAIRFEGDSNVPLHPYLMGALIGDGSFTGGRGSVKFHNIDHDVIQRVRSHVESMGLSLVKYKHGCEYGLSGSRPNPISDAIDKLGLRVRDHFKFIPECYLRLPRAMRMELLAGLVDTDGTTDWFTSSSETLARQFAGLVRSLGGKATVHDRIVDSPRGLAWAVYWRMNDRVPLAISRKQAENQRGREIDYRRMVCRSAVLVGEMETGDIEVDHPAHCYVTESYTIVSNSSKTETALVEMVVHATGVIPYSLRDIGIDWSKKLRGPIQCRIGLESITTTMHNVMLPKLQWFHWTGIDEPGGDRGHWGWIPRSCLIDGEWEKSWSEKYRTLRLLYKDPNHFDRVLGESSIQFTSHDQAPEKMASGDLHFILLDEPPPLAIWRESQVRTARVSGRVLLAMTWPDDPSINVDWIFDEIWEPGQVGPNRNPNIDLYRLISTENKTIDQTGLLETYRDWDDRTLSVRVQGMPIRFSNRIHPLFTDTDQYFCFQCGEARMQAASGACSKCSSTRGVVFNHVQEFIHDPNWPVIWVVDPHPRKPHMSAYIAVSPQDEFYQIAELECSGSPFDLRKECDEVQEMLGLSVRMRLIDPKMAQNPSGAVRERTWLDEFDEAGLYCDPADNSDVGRERFNDLLKPDELLGRSVIHVHPRCVNTITQMKRFMWDDWRNSSDKAQKQKAKEKYDDYPAIWRYFCNADPKHSFLARGAKVVRSAFRKGATR